MIITTQVTEDYYPKALLLWESVKKYWPGRFVLGCIGFDPEGYNGEWFRCELSDIKSYRTDWPKNRQGYVSMQNGEFIEWIKCNEDDIIIQIDADAIMQRPMTDKEINHLKIKAELYDIMSVHSSNPPTNLSDVLINLGGKEDKRWTLEREFTASFLIAKPKMFRSLMGEYIYQFDSMTRLTNHHAGTQWLTNICCTLGSVYILDPIFQCASWYNTFDTTVEDGVLKYKGETVLFNHTK